MHETPPLHRWLSSVRVIVGRIVVNVGTMHAIGERATPDPFTRTVGGMAASGPVRWYAGSPGALALSVSGPFGPSLTFGMVGTGLGLISGALTCVAMLTGSWRSSPLDGLLGANGAHAVASMPAEERA